MPQPADRMRTQRSLTSHHLFPPLVALWFGALFGLSTLAVRTSLFEELVLASGFDRLVPAASPPLGHLARLLIAAVFGLLGAGIGMFIARLAAGARGGARRPEPAPTAGPADETGAADHYKVRARDAHPDAPARRPLSIHDELGAPLLAADADAEAQSGEETAAEVAPVADDTPLPDWLREPMPLAAEAGEALVVAEPEPEPESQPEAAIAPVAVHAPEPVAAVTAAVADPAYPDAWRNTAERIARAHPSALSHVELIERLAIVLGNRDAPAAANVETLPVPGPTSGPVPGKSADATIAALREALATLRQG